MSEVWKDIEDCEGRYQVSNMGRLRSKSLVKVIHRYGHDIPICYIICSSKWLLLCTSYGL